MSKVLKIVIIVVVITLLLAGTGIVVALVRNSDSVTQGQQVDNNRPGNPDKPEEIGIAIELSDTELYF